MAQRNDGYSRYLLHRLPHRAPLVPAQARERQARHFYVSESSEFTIWRTLCCQNFESANVWSHFAASLAVFAYVVVRFVMYNNRDSLDSVFLLHLVASASAGLLFLASAAFHSAAAYQAYSAYLREFDYAMVLIASSTSVIADIGVSAYSNSRGTTGSNEGVSIECQPQGRGVQLRWQSYADPAIGAAVPVLTFLIIRVVRSPSSTWTPQRSKTQDNQRRWSRWGHHDGPLYAPRLVVSLVILIQWIGVAAFEGASLPRYAGPALLSCNAAGTTIVLLFAINDLRELSDRLLSGVAWLACCPRAHTLWHLATSIAVFAIIAARDVALEMAYSRQGCEEDLS